VATKSIRDSIVDAALSLSEKYSWEGLRLYQVAAELGITLDQLRVHFREKEDIVDAWFNRADSAMLCQAVKPDFLQLPARSRLHQAFMAWLLALSPYRRVTNQMVMGKLEPGHLHYQINGLLRVSRTVQWLREACHLDARLPWRAIEEIGLTTIVLLTFARWTQDSSENSRNTAVLLEGLLSKAERIVQEVGLCRPRMGTTIHAAAANGTEYPPHS